MRLLQANHRAWDWERRNVSVRDRKSSAHFRLIFGFTVLNHCACVVSSAWCVRFYYFCENQSVGRAMPTKLFIGNISESCTEEDLKKHFEEHGKVVEHAIVRNYGFVHYEQQEEAEKAMKALHNTSLKGNLIRVELSKTPHKTGAGRPRFPSENAPRSRYRGGGGQGGSGYQRDPYYRGYPSPRDRYHPYYEGGRRSSPSRSMPQYGYYSSYDSSARDYDSRDYSSGSYSSDYYSSYGRSSYGGAVTYPRLASDSSSRSNNHY